MRILAVTPYYDPEGGGLERYAHETLRRLAARGHDVEAVAFTRQGARRDNVDGVAVSRAAPQFVAGNTPIHAGLSRRLRKAMESDRPDVVVAHTPVPYSAEMAARAATRERIPFVVVYHGGRLQASSAWLRPLAALDRVTLERAMVSRAATCIAVSPYVRDHALARRKSSVTLVPPGVDARLFSPDGDGAKGHGILMVAPLSRAYRWKGTDVLWQAFEHVRRDIPDATLTLVGEGDRAAEFRLRAERSKGTVRVRGRLSPRELAREYRRSAVTVLPSTSDAEAFGMVLAEANACGRPVVGSRIGGIPDFVEDGKNGLLAKPGDARHLARCIEEILGQPQMARRMGAAGRGKVLREHDWDDLARRTELVLEQAAS